MARYFDVHPQDPQPRAITQAVKIVLDGGLIAYPTDSCYALGAQVGNRDALDRIRSIRRLDDKHHFTLVCRDFAQLGQFVHIGNDVFRSIKAVTPGGYTFILPATREVPRRLQHPKRKTIGLRIPENVIAQSLLTELNEPLMSSTLMLPGEDLPLSDPEEIRNRLEHELDLVIDGGFCGLEPTSVIELEDGAVTLVRQGKGDTARFAT